MQKGFKIAALAGALSMAMGGVASAANHDLQFGGWSATAGDINHSTAGVCSSGQYNCVVVAAGKGFKQLQVSPVAGSTTTDPTATDSYIMTIVTDQNADGAYGSTGLGFYDVSFVKMQVNLGGVSAVNENGIFSEQKIAEQTGATPGTQQQGTQFDSTTNISTGWATAAASPVSIRQNLKDLGATVDTGDDFESNFMYSSDLDANGTRTGFEMSIDQSAGLASVGQAATIGDIQVFALREKQGTKLAGTGTVNLGGNTMSWTDGQDIKAIWLGQSINLDSVPGGTTGGNQAGLGSSFGYMSFDNVADGNAPITQFGFDVSNASGAWAWNDAFNINGTKTPCLADPTGVTCPPL